MSITVLKLDATTETIQPSQGPCKDAMIEKGVVSAPPESFQVLFENKNVDTEPLSQFDGKKLTIAPVAQKGGS
jgi:hypothetical protein